MARISLKNTKKFVQVPGTTDKWEAEVNGDVISLHREAKQYYVMRGISDNGEDLEIVFSSFKEAELILGFTETIFGQR